MVHKRNCSATPSKMKIKNEIKEEQITEEITIKEEPSESVFETPSHSSEKSNLENSSKVKKEKDLIRSTDPKHPEKVKSFRCKYCHKLFVQNGSKTRHERLHTGERLIKYKLVTKRLPTSETDKKRCRKAVTLETKQEVLRRIEAGEKIVEISKAMGLAKSSIQTIRDKKEDIKTYLQSAGPLNISRLTRQRNWILEKMEKLLIIWIEDNNKLKIPMTRMTIQEKALSIFKNLKKGDTNESEDVTFQASRGWFEKFKNRFNLHNLKLKGEAASADEAASNEYPNILKGIIERGGYKPEQVFNVDETGLYWKRMPDCTYVSKTEKSAPDESDVLDLLAADREPLSYEELIQLQAEPAIDEDTEPVVSKQLTSKIMSSAFSYFEQGINILLENDPDVERSANVSRGINSAISCYKSLKEEIDKKARQTTLDKFFKPPAQNDGDSDL